MDKNLLIEKYIKVSVRKALEEQEVKRQNAEKAMYLVYRFPGLKKVIEDVMSPSFGRFVSDIKILAPKPTTFKVSLVNGQKFNIIYLGDKKWNVKVSGKKFYIQNKEELDRACNAIADLLELNYAPKEESVLSKGQNPEKDKEMAADLGMGGGRGGNIPEPGETSPEGEENTPEEIPNIPEQPGEEENTPNPPEEETNK